MRAVLVTGSVGVGKTAVAAELGELLAERGLKAAVVDLDWLGWLAGADGGVDGLILANLSAVVPNFRTAGATHLVLARSVRDAQLVHELREALPESLSVVRLTASRETVSRRLVARDVGAQLAEHLEEESADADVAEFEVANDDVPVRAVAQELARRLGWA